MNTQDLIHGIDVEILSECSGLRHHTLRWLWGQLRVLLNAQPQAKLLADFSDDEIAAEYSRRFGSRFFSRGDWPSGYLGPSSC